MENPTREEKGGAIDGGPRVFPHGPGQKRGTACVITRDVQERRGKSSGKKGEERRRRL